MPFFRSLLASSSVLRLPFAAPIPPLALLGGEVGITCLRHGGTENIETADILTLAGHATELFVKAFRLLPRQLPDRANAQQLKISHHGWPNGNQIFQTTFFMGHGLLSLDRKNIQLNSC